MNMGPYEQGLVQSYNQVHLRLVNQPKVIEKIIIIDPDASLKAERAILSDQLSLTRQRLATAEERIIALSTALEIPKIDPKSSNQIKRIISLVCCNERISQRDLIGPSRLKELVYARHIAIYLCIILTRRSLPEIARRFGGRDHTSILHARRKVTALRQCDQELNFRLQKYVEAFHGPIERGDADGAVRRGDLPIESGPQEAVGAACDSLFCDG